MNLWEEIGSDGHDVKRELWLVARKMTDNPVAYRQLCHDLMDLAHARQVTEDLAAAWMEMFKAKGWE